MCLNRHRTFARELVDRLKGWFVDLLQIRHEGTLPVHSWARQYDLLVFDRLTLEPSKCVYDREKSLSGPRLRSHTRH
jgi:hypothetical protein